MKSCDVLNRYIDDKRQGKMEDQGSIRQIYKRRRCFVFSNLDDICNESEWLSIVFLETDA